MGGLGSNRTTAPAVAGLTAAVLVLASGLAACGGIGAAPPEDDAAVAAGGQLLPIEGEVRLGSGIVELEVARTDAQRAIGLMYRTDLPDNRGMLFLFDPPRSVSFWMMNVPIPLDIVFLDNGRVTAISADVPPCKEEPCPRYGAPGPVDAVLEVRGGLAEERGIEVGDELPLELAGEGAPR